MPDAASMHLFGYKRMFVLVRALENCPYLVMYLSSAGYSNSVEERAETAIIAAVVWK